MTRDYSRLLKPRSVALLGTEGWCRDVISNLREMGYVWDIWPVVPGERTVGGLRAFAAVEGLPDAPDLAFIGAEGEAAVALVSALADIGAGAALVPGEADAAALAEAAGDMLLLGPGCRGMINAMERAAIWDGPHGLRPVRRGVAILARSPSLAQTLTMQRRGLPIACIVVAAPGPAQTRMAVLARALLEDERITALGVQAEDLGGPELFLSLAQVAERLGKSVVVLRAGEEPGATALIARGGMARVRTPEAFLEALKILHVTGALPANTLAALSFGGCAASLIRELGTGRGLSFPAFSAAQQRALSDALGLAEPPENPIDAFEAVTLPAPELTRIVVEAMSGRAVLTLLVMECPREDRCPDAAWDHLAEAAADARHRVGMPLALVSTLPEGMPEARTEALMAQGLIPLAGLAAAFEALQACVTLGGPLRHPAPLFMPVGGTASGKGIDTARVHASLAAEGVEVGPASDPAEPELRLHIAAQPSFGYVLGFARGLERATGLLPLRAGEAQALLAQLGLDGEAAAAVVPAVLSVQDYVIAQNGALVELELSFDPGQTGGARASGLRVRAAGG